VARAEERSEGRGGNTPPECAVIRVVGELMRLAPYFLIGSLALGMPVSGFGQSSFRDGQVRQGVLSFDGKATLGDFVGTTSTVTGQMTGGAELSAVRGWVEATVNTLKTGNGRRDRDLNKSMESDKFPTMRFDLTGVTPGATRGDTTDIVLNGAFTIHGVKRTVSMPAVVLIQPDGIRLRSDFPLNLKDYEIGGLSKMLGMLKMNPDIVVHVDLLFAQ
jgi:polyisoprenoid-binding protein YceI